MALLGRIRFARRVVGTAASYAATGAALAAAVPAVTTVGLVGEQDGVPVDLPVDDMQRAALQDLVDRVCG